MARAGKQSGRQLWYDRRARLAHVFFIVILFLNVVLALALARVLARSVAGSYLDLFFFLIHLSGFFSCLFEIVLHLSDDCGR